ncbi:putative ammonium transporter 2 [Chironomus tepperi]|uniref:putative ammonium transporter 2 n=1 Tax=Chironomus tepperi TaxID=113505 RepID=UPI00391F4CDF
MSNFTPNFTELFENTFKTFPRNDSYALPGLYELEVGDAAFPLCICLMIFQMQTGFALIESGIVRPKNSVNIMMKNIADVCIGGLAFYMFGFALAFGRGQYTTPFFGAGDFFPNTKFGDPLTCQVFTLLLYQMSYATTR